MMPPGFIDRTPWAGIDIEGTDDTVGPHMPGSRGWCEQCGQWCKRDDLCTCCYAIPVPRHLLRAWAYRVRHFDPALAEVMEGWAKGIEELGPLP